MGFHKRIIHKETILENINNLDVLFNAEVLVMDNWSRKFQKDLSKKDKDLIQQLHEKNMLKSFHTDDYKQLSSLAECLISLMVDPHWEPLLYTLDRLKVEVVEEERGRFTLLKKKAIDAIVEFYEN